MNKIALGSIIALAVSGFGLVGVTSASADDANEVPDSTDDAYSMTQGETLTVDALTGLLANDVATGPTPLTVVEWFNYNPNDLLVNTDGSFSFTPQPDFSGLATFQYKAGAGNWWGYARTVSITVTPVAVAPVEQSDEPSTPQVSGVTAAADSELEDSGDSELPVLAYTGSDDVASWLLAPALGLLGIGALGLWVSRRRTRLA